MAAAKVRHGNEGHSHNQQGTNDPTSALGQGGACQRRSQEAAPGEEGHDITQDGTIYKKTTNKERGTNSAAPPDAWDEQSQ
jgi:hypothetical protein